MKFTGEISINAPRATVFEKLRDARFFVSCVEGVNDLVETDATHYAAVFETKVAYLKFKFNVTVELTKVDAPNEIEAKIEGTPLGVVGRLTARSLMRLSDEGAGTKVLYETEVDLGGQARQYRAAGAARKSQGHGTTVRQESAGRVSGRLDRIFFRKTGVHLGSRPGRAFSGKCFEGGQ